MKRLLGAFLLALLTACGEEGGGLSAEDVFVESLRLCRVDDYSVRIDGLGAVYYTIIGRQENDCRVEMVFVDSPNEAWIDQPLVVHLREDRRADTLRDTVAACIEGRRPQVTDGSCNGELMAVLRQTGADGGPVLADEEFAQSRCGTAYAQAQPARLRMRSAATGLWGYLGPDGTWAIAPQFVQATDFSEGLAAVLEGDIWQIIAPDGSVAIASVSTARVQSYTTVGRRNVYQSPIKPFSDNCARLNDDKGIFYLSRDGKLWLDAPTQAMADAAQAAGGAVSEIDPFGAGLGGFTVDVEKFGQLDPKGFIDASGTISIAPQYAQIGVFDRASGLAPVGVARGLDSVFTDGWIYINTYGRKVLPKTGDRYRSAERFSDGYAAVRIDRRFQYVSTKGALLSADEYSVAQPFSDGMAYVRFRDDQYGWINIRGERAFTAKEIGLCDVNWPLQSPFHDGHALVVVAKNGDGCGQGASVTLGGGTSTYKNGEFAYVTKSGDLVFRESSISAP